MKKPYFTEGDIFHIYNRGVEKRDVFLDDKDYLRFVHDLYEFNDLNPVRNLHYFLNRKTNTVESRRIRQEPHKRDLLVEILVFTLMPNHYHFMVRQLKENGIVKFMQKLGTGYAMYFNKKYERVGALFQGSFKAARVSTETHFIHLPHYIHTNPLALQNDISDPMRFLETYRWSSFPDYTGLRSFPSVTSREFLLGVYGGREAYRKYTEDRLIHIEDNSAELIGDLALE